MPKDNNTDDNGNASHALTIFSMKYSPATIETVTDKFSSKEILNLLKSHLGETITLAELHNLLRDMKYDYIMSDNEFVWLCKLD
jgi:hypothetical protein